MTYKKKHQEPCIDHSIQHNFYFTICASSNSISGIQRNKDISRHNLSKTAIKGVGSKLTSLDFYTPKIIRGAIGLDSTAFIIGGKRYVKNKN